MGSSKHPNATPETPMLIPGKVEDFLNKYFAPFANASAKKMPFFSVVKHVGRTSGKASRCTRRKKRSCAACTAASSCGCRSRNVSP